MLRSKLAVAAALCGASLLAACATPGRPEQMVVAAGALAPAQVGAPGYQAVSIGQVTGGAETNPMWMSNVSATNFRAALEQSLRAAGHLAGSTGGSNYIVDAQLLNLDRPGMGLDMTVTSSVRYDVKASSGAMVFQDTIQARGTATMGDALIGTERLRKANEASVRENIQTFITRLRERLGQASSSAP